MNAQTKSQSLAAVLAAAAVAVLLLAEPARVAVLGAVALVALALLVNAIVRREGGRTAQHD